MQQAENAHINAVIPPIELAIHIIMKFDKTGSILYLVTSNIFINKFKFNVKKKIILIINMLGTVFYHDTVCIDYNEFMRMI